MKKKSAIKKGAVPIKEICPDCIGFGEERSSNGYGQGYRVRKCSSCNGTGRKKEREK